MIFKLLLPLFFAYSVSADPIAYLLNVGDSCMANFIYWRTMIQGASVGPISDYWANIVLLILGGSALFAFCFMSAGLILLVAYYVVNRKKEDSSLNNK